MPLTPTQNISIAFVNKRSDAFHPASSFTTYDAPTAILDRGPAARIGHTRKASIL
jgi:hypothetical protein